MAFDAFLEIEGVAGESQRAGHEGQIELMSFSWGASNPVSITTGSGLGAGKVNVSSFNFMKYTDGTSPTLFQKCCNGKHFPKAKVTFYKAAGDDGALDYLVYEFEGVFVDSIQWSGGGEGIPMESVSFTFEKCTINYTVQNSDGTKKGVTPGSWNLVANTP
jgi:type VI secretion system secreted protein Hcp